MKAVVLAAGKGKRMHPLTKKKPKALVKLKGKPLLEHVLAGFEKAGVKETIVVIGFLGEKIEKKFGKKFGKMKLSYVDQRVQMGTAHAVLQMKKKLRGKFLVGHADVIVKPSLWKKLMEKKGFDAVITLRKDKHPEKFGVAVTKGKRLEKIVEKPKDKKLGNLVNAAAYLFGQKIFSALEKTKVSKRGEFELTDSINILAAKGKTGFVVYKGKCLDIGSIKELREAEKA